MSIPSSNFVAPEPQTPDDKFDRRGLPPHETLYQNAQLDDGKVRYIRDAIEEGRHWLLCGPRFSGKQFGVGCLAHDVHVARVNVRWYVAQRPEQRRAALWTLDESANRKRIVVFDGVDGAFESAVIHELLQRLHSKEGCVFVANVPGAPLQLETAEFLPVTSDHVTELTYEGVWASTTTLGRALHRLPESSHRLIRNAVGDHPLLGRLLIDAVALGMARIPANSRELVRAWRELAGGIWRSFFQERSREIRQESSICAAVRELFRRPGSVAWAEDKANYMRLAEWGIVQFSGSRVEPASDVMDAWLGSTFASDLL